MSIVIFNSELKHNIDVDAITGRGTLHPRKGFFESMRYMNGEIPLLYLHRQRIMQAAGMVGLNINEPEDPEILEYINILTKDLSGNNFKIRLTFFEDPQISEHNYSWIMESELLKDTPYSANEDGLKIIYTQLSLSENEPLSGIKHLNRAVYNAALTDAIKSGADDAFVNDDRKYLAESCMSNIFCYRDGHFFTPKLRSGCVGGVMRRLLLEKLPQLGYTVIETDIDIPMLSDMDSIYLSNAVKGVNWVVSVDDLAFDKGPLVEIVDMLNQHIGY